ncbi:MAG: hypothetical protein MUE44_12110 [Oscillatoriaceae cyanobacterium Prado104]|nr:hypothetical protein [Oscillatoriaceae cyanobacterium Prado104]
MSRSTNSELVRHEIHHLILPETTAVKAFVRTNPEAVGATSGARHWFAAKE